MSNELTVDVKSVLVRDPNHVSGELDGETVLMGVAQGKYYHLEGVAQRIWEMLKAPTQVSVLVEALMAEFEVNQADCESGVLEFLDQLHNEGLVQLTESQPGD